MQEDEIIEETTTEDSTENINDTTSNVPEDVPEDIPEILPDHEDVAGDEFESLEDVENEFLEREDTGDSSADVIENDGPASVSDNDIEELPEDMTEELTEELLEEMSSESNEYILYMTEQETEVPFLQKSFAEYSTTESLLLLIFVVIFLWFLKNIVFD